MTNFSWGIVRKSLLSALLSLAAVLMIAAVMPALSCDVAVVSGKYTTDGRPVLWKNFDCSAAWAQQVIYFPAKNPKAGDYFMLYHHDDLMELINNSPVMPQSGANEAGFAVSVAAVYEDLAPLHESGNLNTDLVQDAVEQCATLEDFESLLKTWPSTHRNHAISANFVVVDAHGGAALYECYTGTYSFGLMYIQYRKYDANTGKVTDDKGKTIMEAPANHPGFINRTNLNHYVWYNSGVDRYLRAQDLLTDLAAGNRLNAQSIMQVVSKDVVGRQAYGNSASNYSTTYCISRNQTRSGTVFQGVAAGDDPLKSVYWTALGEPSIAVYVPHMIGARSVSEYAYMDKIGSDGTMQDLSDNSLLTIAEDKLEISAGIHTSNRGSVLTGVYNKYIDKTALANVQQWTIPLENTVIDKTDEFISQLDSDPALLTQQNLQAFTSYCGKYIYENYIASSAEAVPWTFSLIAEPPVEPGEDPGTEPDEEPPDEPGDDPGTEPGEESPDEPGEDPGTEPGEESPDEPGDDPGTEPGEEPPAEPGDDPGTEPGEESPADPGEDPGTEPGEEPPADPGEDPGTEPGEEPPADPGEDPGTEPGEEPITDPSEDTPPEEPAGPAYDKSVLKSLILTATINIETATVSTDGRNVTPAEQWVTREERAAYKTAINTATAVAQNSKATQAEVDQAVKNLRAADQAFFNAKKPGTKSGVTLSGRVSYKERLFKPRYPVEGAKIYIRSKGNLYAAYSDANGNFELITDLPAGFYTIYCTHPQYGQIFKFQFIGLFDYYEFLYTI